MSVFHLSALFHKKRLLWAFAATVYVRTVLLAESRRQAAGPSTTHKKAGRGPGRDQRARRAGVTGHTPSRRGLRTLPRGFSFRGAVALAPIGAASVLFGARVWIVSHIN